MSSDPVLTAAISHWGPRFVANGVVLTDFEEVTGSIATYDDWCKAWSARAAHHEAIARQAQAKKHYLTAGECFQRAGVYYHFASFLFLRDMAQMKAAHKKQIECRQTALPYLDPPGERVEIPYEGKTLAGILRKPKGIAKDSTRPRKKPTPTKCRSWRAVWRRWYSKGRVRARRNTTSPSAATTRCRSRP